MGKGEADGEEDGEEEGAEGDERSWRGSLLLFSGWPQRFDQPPFKAQLRVPTTLGGWSLYNQEDALPLMFRHQHLYLATSSRPYICTPYHTIAHQHYTVP